VIRHSFSERTIQHHHDKTEIVRLFFKKNFSLGKVDGTDFFSRQENICGFSHSPPKRRFPLKNQTVTEITSSTERRWDMFLLSNKN